MTRMISFVVLIGILVAIGVLFFQLMSIFLVPVFFSALLGVIFFPLHARILTFVGSENRYLASALSISAVLLVVLGPAALVASLASLEGVALIEQLRSVSVQGRLTKIREQYHLEIPHNEDLAKIETVLTRIDNERDDGLVPDVPAEIYANLSARCEALRLFAEESEKSGDSRAVQELSDSIEVLSVARPGSVDFDQALDNALQRFSEFKLGYLGGPYSAWLKGIANPSSEQIEQIRNTLLINSRTPLLSLGEGVITAIVKIIVGIIIMATTLFFIFADGKQILDELLSFSPLEERYVRELLSEFDRVSRAVVVAVLLAAIVQGALAGIGFHFVGVGSVFLLMLLTTLLALIPFLGAASVWVPVCLWLYLYQDRPGAAFGFFLYGFFIVSLADNFVKPLVLHGQSNLHPLLAMLSVLGGVQALGPIGILIGPMVVVFLQTLVRILHREFKSFQQSIGEPSGDQEDDSGQEKSAQTEPEMAVETPASADSKAKAIGVVEHKAV